MKTSIPFIEWPEIMTVDDVIDCCGFPRDDVYRMFKRSDFPLTCPEKKAKRRVGKFAFRSWLNKGIEFSG